MTKVKLANGLRCSTTCLQVGIAVPCGAADGGSWGKGLRDETVQRPQSGSSPTTPRCTVGPAWPVSPIPAAGLAAGVGVSLGGGAQCLSSPVPSRQALAAVLCPTPSSAQ